jgi:poly-gamma-glutamate capsule biosynthesis protein CapA/YwtB (metallophosphatase superfamily)
VLSVANNPVLDFGTEGRESTVATLDAAGIKHAGADRGSRSTTVLEVKGRKVAFVGFAHNAFVPDVNDIAAAQRYVREASARADIVVVSFHGGGEGESAERVPYGTETYFKQLRGNLRVFTKAVIDAGADLVLGHGPHVLRGLELYKERLIVYSMGNFATYGMFNLKGPQGITAIFELELAEDGRFVEGRIHAGKQVGRGLPVLDPDGQAIRKVRELSDLDFGQAAPRIDPEGRISPK